MNFEQIKQYHQSFFLNRSLENELASNLNFFNSIVQRGELLKKGQIIFDDPLDMEAVSTPYALDIANLLETPNGDPEWYYMVSRNGYLVDLAMLFAYTNEEVYADLWKESLLTFIEWQEVSPHLWRSLDVGLRLNNWMRSFVYISDIENLFTQSEIERIETAINKQVVFLKENFPDKNYLSNWGVLAIVGVLATSQLFPEIVSSESTSWGWKTLKEALQLQFYDDGIHWEQSPMYHHEVLFCVWQLWLNTQYLSLPFDAEIEAILQKGIQSSVYYCDQNYRLLPLHDSDAADFTYVYSIYALSGFLSLPMAVNPGILYVGKQFELKEQASSSNLFPDGESGFLAYKDENIYFTMFNGRHGSGHGHASLGSLTLHYKGKEIVKDPGRYTYVEDELRMKLKEEFSHSSLLIDNNPLTKIASSWTYDTMGEPLYHKSSEDEELVVFEVSWKGTVGKEIVVFTRTIIYFKKLTAFLIINHSGCLGKHQLSTRYQIGDEINTEIYNNIVDLKGTSFSIAANEQSSLTINTKKWSPKYNELSEHEELVIEQIFNDEQVSYECIYPTDQIELARIDCYQNKQNKPCSDEQYFGLRLVAKESNKSYEYFHSSRDTVIGDKLYLSENGRLLYGKNKLFIEEIGE